MFSEVTQLYFELSSRFFSHFPSLPAKDELILFSFLSNFIVELILLIHFNLCQLWRVIPDLRVSYNNVYYLRLIQIIRLNNNDSNNISDIMLSQTRKIMKHVFIIIIFEW